MHMCGDTCYLGYACLVEWDELYALSAAYNAFGLERQRGFMRDDYDTVLNISLYLMKNKGEASYNGDEEQ